MTTPEDPTAVREHRRETLNTIIDLLEGLADQQERTDVIISAAAAVSVKVNVPAPPAYRSGSRPSPKRRRAW